MEFKYLKIVVFVPAHHGDKMREALNDAGCGHVGNYDFCSFTMRGTGRFRGLEGSNPYVGESGRLESVKEERIETICPCEKLDEALVAIREAHPYEEPAVDIYPLLN